MPIAFAADLALPSSHPTHRSRLFLYYNARVLRGDARAGNGQLLDNGTSLRACCKVVSRFGVAPEKLWPYQEHLAATRPPPGRLA